MMDEEKINRLLENLEPMAVMTAAYGELQLIDKLLDWVQQRAKDKGHQLGFNPYSDLGCMYGLLMGFNNEAMAKLEGARQSTTAKENEHGDR